MHIEFLVEDSSGAKFLEIILPKILDNETVTWRIHGYRGVGRLPRGLNTSADPAKRALLDQLPRLIAGYGRTPSVDAVVIIVDTDTRDCRAFLAELQTLTASIVGGDKALFRLAIEEMEAWYFGDEAAVKAAYPSSKNLFRSYEQDSVCGTWEKLADVITSGGSEKVITQGWPASGIIKSEWAERITPHMDPERNISQSFIKFREGVRSLIV